MRQFHQRKVTNVRCSDECQPEWESSLIEEPIQADDPAEAEEAKATETPQAFQA